jgi:hypothetical protein
MPTHPGLAVHPPPRRLPPAAPVLALVVAVVVAHAWLVALLAPGTPRAGRPQGAAVLLRSLPATAVAAPAAALAPAGDTLAAPAPTPTARRAVPPGAVPAPRLVADSAADRATAAAPTSAVTEPQADAPVADPEGEPPPLYATRVPPPVTLHYAVRHNGREGRAVLDWQHDGSAYRLTLDAQAADGRPLLAQASTGSFDANGLAPLRFVDRRAQGRQRAANFRRDIGRIGYSGPAHEHPAWPGAQDRLSWLAQLAAIEAAAEPSPDALVLFVADATGQAGLWRLLRQVEAADPADTVHWRREPPRPEGLRIDLWLPARGAGPVALAGWPQRLIFTVPRSGDVLELVLQPPP